MSHLSEHNLDWARHMVRVLDEPANGRNLSTTRKSRRLLAEDAAQWLLGNNWDQHSINQRALWEARL